MINQHRRNTTVSFALLSLLLLHWGSYAHGGRIVTKPEAARHGLNRAWIAQIEVDGFRSRVNQVTLHGGAIFVLTDQGLVHALDAENGQTLWVNQIGSTEHPTLGLAASDEAVAVVSGSRIYLSRRSDGKVVFDRQLGGVPNAGPALAGKRVYVPTMNGPLESYVLPTDPYSTTENEEGGEEKLARNKSGHLFSVGASPVRPLAVNDYLCWPSDRGFLYVAKVGSRTAQFRFEMPAIIDTRPAYRTPLFYGASLGGYVYALDEQSGQLKWKFAIGAPAVETPAVIEDRVYVCAERNGMFCLDAESGDQIWWVPRISTISAVSPTRIYAADRENHLQILDAASGAIVGTLPSRGLAPQLVNQQTDRIYLGTENGLLLCLHEVALLEPIRYGTPPDTEAPETPVDGDDDPFGVEVDQSEDDPFED